MVTTQTFYFNLHQVFLHTEFWFESSFLTYSTSVYSYCNNYYFYTVFEWNTQLLFHKINCLHFSCLNRFLSWFVSETLISQSESLKDLRLEPKGWESRSWSVLKFSSAVYMNRLPLICGRRVHVSSSSLFTPLQLFHPKVQF